MDLTACYFGTLRASSFVFSSSRFDALHIRVLAVPPVPTCFALLPFVAPQWMPRYAYALSRFASDGGRSRRRKSSDRGLGDASRTAAEWKEELREQRDEVTDGLAEIICDKSKRLSAWKINLQSSLYDRERMQISYRNVTNQSIDNDVPWLLW